MTTGQSERLVVVVGEVGLQEVNSLPNALEGLGIIAPPPPHHAIRRARRGSLSVGPNCWI